MVNFRSLKKANSWELNFRDIEIGEKCKKLPTSAAAELALGAYFQKLDVGINKNNSNLDLGTFISFGSALFHGQI